MFYFALLLFAAVLLVIAVAATRGLLHLPDILEVVDTTEQDPARPAPTDVPTPSIR